MTNEKLKQAREYLNSANKYSATNEESIYWMKFVVESIVEYLEEEDKK